MIINRVWAMPNKWTFEIKPIRHLIYKYGGDFKGWIDPFAGMNSPAEYTNDLNPDMPTKYHMEAKEFIDQFNGERFNGCLFDPPYSPRQVSESYKKMGRVVNMKTTQSSFWSNIKNKIAEILNPGGLVICCGWNSMGIGKTRGFRMKEILLVAHGGHHNDTIITVEQKVILN